MVLPEMPDLWQETLGWQPNQEQQQRFQSLYEAILAGNRQLNLTRITQPQEFWEKHLWDSLRGILPVYSLPNCKQVMIDIGTGAGFPGLPVAIAYPESSIILLDSTRKKINFLRQLTTNLGIKNAIPLTGRAETLGQEDQHRNRYDIALIRAVSSASVCAEYTLPLLNIGGLAVLYRGSWTEEETNLLTPVVEQLGGVIERIEPFTTPLTHSIRHCIYLRLISPTPTQFPRGVGIPERQPL